MDLVTLIYLTVLSIISFIGLSMLNFVVYIRYNRGYVKKKTVWFYRAYTIFLMVVNILGWVMNLG